MKFSIIIPTYNQIKLLERCIDSVLNNTTLNEDVEIIIISNGCKDGTLELIKKYSGLYPNIKYVYWPEPLGFPKAINAGFAVSTGEYVVLLNNDSYLLAGNWLEILQEPFALHSEAGLTGPMLQKFNEELFSFIFFCVMIKRDVIKKVGYLDEIFGIGQGEDTDFSFKALKAGFKLYQVPIGKDCSFINETTSLTSGSFPIVHDSLGTRKYLPNLDEIFKRNEAILKKRYNLT